MKNILFTCIVISALCNLNAETMDLDGKTIQLKSFESGYCIQTEGYNDKEGTKIIKYPCEESENQKFTFSKDNEDYYTIKLANGKELSVAGDSQSNGVNIIQSSEGSLFKIIPKDGAFSLQAKHSDKYISTTAYNTDIIQTGNNTQENQWWTINSNNQEYATCKEILEAGKSIGDGIYTIDPDGEDGDAPFEVYCDMTTDGGGWTRIVGNVSPLTMNNNYINQFASNPEVNNIEHWIQNSDGSYEAPTVGCSDTTSLKIKEAIISKSTKVRINAFGEAGNQYPNNCSGWGTLILEDEGDYFYYTLSNAWGTFQKVGKDQNYGSTQSIYNNFSTGVQTMTLKNNLTISIAYKGTPRHIFDISIK